MLALKYILIILKNKKKKYHLGIATVNIFSKYPSKTSSLNV